MSAQDADYVRDCQCPPNNTDCQHPTCPRYMPERSRTVQFRERTFPDKLRWLADKLDRDGDDDFTRFAVASAMLAVAADLEHNAAQHRLAQIDGYPEAGTAFRGPAPAEAEGTFRPPPGTPLVANEDRTESDHNDGTMGS